MKCVNLLVVLALVFALTLFFPFPSQVHAETEPNDTPGQANPIDIGWENAEINATISPTSDVDYFKFDACAGCTYVIETFEVHKAGSSDGTGLWLYSTDGTTLLDSDSYGSNGTGHADARVVHTFLTAGTYYIRVREGDFEDWWGTYSLRVLPKYDEPGAGWDTSNDDEPNDAWQLATEIGIGLNQAETHQIHALNSAYVTHAGDVDWYRFYTPANRTYVIETFEVHKAGSSDGTGLWLYSTDGTTLLDSDSYGSNGTGHADARVVHTFLTAGTYYIRVREGDFEDWWGTYSLRVLPKYDEPGAGWDSANDMEPNDVWQLANSLSVGKENAQTHQIHALDAYYVTHAADRDWYHFNAKADVEYAIETFNVANQGSYGTGLWLHDKDTLLANDQYGSVGGKEGVWARIRYTFLTSGVYFVKVAPESYSSWTGTYSVHVCAGECLEHVFLPLVLRNAQR